MIDVTKLNGDSIILNADLIESVEARPDTLITLTTGNKIMVKEKVADIIDRVQKYRQDINMVSLEKFRDQIAEEQE